MFAGADDEPRFRPINDGDVIRGHLLTPQGHPTDTLDAAIGSYLHDASRRRSGSSLPGSRSSRTGSRSASPAHVRNPDHPAERSYSPPDFDSVVTPRTPQASAPPYPAHGSRSRSPSRSPIPRSDDFGQRGGGSGSPPPPSYEDVVSGRFVELNP